MKGTRITTMVAGAALVALGFSRPAQAGTYHFELPAGSKESGGNAVSGTADVTTGAGTITVVLDNTIVGQNTVAQNISDLFFKISSGDATTVATTSSSGAGRNVANDGSWSSAGTLTAGWTSTGNALGVVHLDDLNGAQFTPAHTIIGQPSADNKYDNAGGSITQSSSHQPFLYGPVTFNLTVTGVTANTVISDVIFSFGTVSGNNVSTVPEPMYFQMGSLIGLGGLGLLRYRRSRK